LEYFVTNIVVMGVLVLSKALDVPIWLVDVQEESEIKVV
jgi:hypothetical protein